MAPVTLHHVKKNYGDAPVILVQQGPVRPMRATGTARAPSPGG